MKTFLHRTHRHFCPPRCALAGRGTRPAPERNLPAPSSAPRSPTSRKAPAGTPTSWASKSCFNSIKGDGGYRPRGRGAHGRADPGPVGPARERPARVGARLLQGGIRREGPGQNPRAAHRARRPGRVRAVSAQGRPAGERDHPRQRRQPDPDLRQLTGAERKSTCCIQRETKVPSSGGRSGLRLGIGSRAKFRHWMALREGARSGTFPRKSVVGRCPSGQREQTVNLPA